MDRAGRARHRRRPPSPDRRRSHGIVVRPLPRFIVVVLVWLVAALVVWWFASPVLMWPAKLLVQVLARVGLSDLVQSVEQNGVPPIFTFATTLRPGQAAATSARIAVDVNTLLYSFGLPMYAALVVAAREPHWPRNLAIGYAILIPVRRVGGASPIS